jgi:aspartate aminotransferase
MRLAARMSRIGTETAFEAAARARALEATGRSVVHLEIGEPDFDTPAHVRDAAKRALDEGATHYAPFAGIPQLRQAIADDAAARKGFAVTPDRVFVTVGGKGVMLYAILGLVDEGDEVIVPDPGYPIYDSLTRFVGGTAVPIPIRQENDFRLDVDELASLVTPRTRLVVINSPANPTGGVLTRDDIERIAAIAREHDLLVLADEIYSRILYDGAEHVSIASLPGMAERTIVLDGFSKTFAMTGWRLGYAIVPDPLREAYGTLLINTVSGATTFAQVGAVEAIRGPQDAVDAMVAEFLARRDLVVDGLNDIPGIRCARPSGAFYVFPDVSGTGLSGDEMAARLLPEAGVCVLSGTAFGAVGAGHIRISYANSRENLREALERIRGFVAGLGDGARGDGARGDGVASGASATGARGH